MTTTTAESVESAEVDKTEAPFTYWLTAEQVAATKKKVAKKAARAQARGFAGSVAVEVGSRTRKERRSMLTGELVGPDYYPARVVTLHDLRITGTAPCYAGWTFLARIEALGERKGTQRRHSP